jgi:flavin-dependent dehydrogenase
MSPRQKAQCQVNGEIPELFFTADLKGYGWVFRKGDYLNIGLGREDKHRLSGHLASFCNYLAKIDRIPRDLPGKFKGHAYLLYHHARRNLVQNGIMLIGDAAGLAYAQSGEGIRPAVESALLAARVIHRCQGDYSAGRLHAYVDNLEAHFGTRQPASGRGVQISPRLRQLLARLLMKNHWFSRNLLIRRWFLHNRDKPLPASIGHFS